LTYEEDVLGQLRKIPIINFVNNKSEIIYRNANIMTDYKLNSSCCMYTFDMCFHLEHLEQEGIEQILQLRKRHQDIFRLSDESINVAYRVQHFIHVENYTAENRST